MECLQLRRLLSVGSLWEITLKRLGTVPAVIQHTTAQSVSQVALVVIIG